MSIYDTGWYWYRVTLVYTWLHLVIVEPFCLYILRKKVTDPLRTDFEGGGSRNAIFDQVHRGNRELHRELRRKEVRGDQEEAGDKYKVSDTTRPRTAREPLQKLGKNLEQEKVEENEEEEDSSDSDSGLFEMADMSQADKIVSLSVTNETRLTHNSELFPTRSPRRQGSRPGSAATAALHPLNGLLQPTGRVPQAGYQATPSLLED